MMLGAGLGVGLIFLLLAGVIVALVFYLLTLQKTLNAIDPSRRQVAPGNVWLLFIPLFNLIYPFILYPKICDSIKAEYEARGLNEEGSFGKGLGITLPILGLVGIVPGIGAIAGLGRLVIWIVFWVKMAGYKKILESNTGNEGVLDA